MRLKGGGRSEGPTASPGAHARGKTEQLPEPWEEARRAQGSAGRGPGRASVCGGRPALFTSKFAPAEPRGLQWRHRTAALPGSDLVPSRPCPRPRPRGTWEAQTCPAVPYRQAPSPVQLCAASSTPIHRPRLLPLETLSLRLLSLHSAKLCADRDAGSCSDGTLAAVVRFCSPVCPGPRAAVPASSSLSPCSLEAALLPPVWKPRPDSASWNATTRYPVVAAAHQPASAPLTALRSHEGGSGVLVSVWGSPRSQRLDLSSSDRPVPPSPVLTDHRNPRRTISIPKTRWLRCRSRSFRTAPSNTGPAADFQPGAPWCRRCRCSVPLAPSCSRDAHVSIDVTQGRPLEEGLAW